MEKLEEKRGACEGEKRERGGEGKTRNEKVLVKKEGTGLFPVNKKRGGLCHCWEGWGGRKERKKEEASVGTAERGRNRRERAGRCACGRRIEAGPY